MLVYGTERPMLFHWLAGYTLKSPLVLIVTSTRPSVAKPGTAKLEDSSGSLLIWGPGRVLTEDGRAKTGIHRLTSGSRRCRSRLSSSKWAPGRRRGFNLCSSGVDVSIRSILALQRWSSPLVQGMRRPCGWNHGGAEPARALRLIQCFSLVETRPW